MRVEWKEGRRALVWDTYDDVWVEAVGRSDLRCVNGAKGWLCCPVNDEAFGFEAPSDSPDVRLLPGQCPRCFEVDDHADGCMVAANLARGVPPFWAPWAMEAPPDSDNFATILTVEGCSMREVGLWSGRFTWAPNDHVDEWRVKTTGEIAEGPFVAIGPDGPTLEPWEGQS